MTPAALRPRPGHRTRVTSKGDDGEMVLELSATDLAPDPGSSVFRPGEVVASRFRVVRFLARGGMGELYEAEDLELHERVALKTILSTTGQDERSIKMFKREVHLARQVTHPNVCRIFDVFRHRPPAAAGATGRAPDIVFLAMELLHGETLSDRLRREGRLSTADALVLARQMASALTAAHRAGVVHRDFKSQNVMLVEAGGARRGGARRRHRLRPRQAQLGGRSLQRCPSRFDDDGEISGTPAYMAPEQVEGGPATPATDQYALGVVLYEMVTGTRPFMGDTPIKIAVKRLQEPPPSPRTHVPDLDATLGSHDPAVPGPRAFESLPERRRRHGRAGGTDGSRGRRKEADRAPVAGRGRPGGDRLPPISGPGVSSAEAPRASPPSPCCPSPTPRRTRTRNTSRTASAKA